MRDWERYWSTAPAEYSDCFKQVGKTVCGRPISEGQFDALIRDISNSLSLRKGDRLLDLCCGNGLVTKRLSESVGSVTAVDGSEFLIEVAKREHGAENIQYVAGSALRLDAVLECTHAEGLFDKVLMSAALQYFDESDLPSLLDGIHRVLSPTGCVLLSDIPDRNRLWQFYNTPRRRLAYIVRSAVGREALGKWWRADRLIALSAARGFSATQIVQARERDGCHYRFDLLLAS